MQATQSITPREFAGLAQDSRPVLLDVREPWEYDLVHVESAQLLPLGQINEWAKTLDPNGQFVVMCHHGGRSAMACQFLQRMRVKNAVNLEGGIDSWSMTVDPALRRY